MKIEQGRKFIKNIASNLKNESKVKSKNLKAEISLEKALLVNSRNLLLGILKFSNFIHWNLLHLTT
jgi:hypothetical protein